MTSSLPSELWFAIVAHLFLGDQFRISQVSHQLCAVARRFLYRNVYLRSNNSAAQATLALLARDHSVARNVKQLHISTTEKSAKEPTWFNVDALAGLTNLRVLCLTEMPFRTKEDQVKFNNAVSEFLPGLRNLVYCVLNPDEDDEDEDDEDGDDEDEDDEDDEDETRMLGPGIHVPILQISGLQEITWIDPDAFVCPSPILTSINASRETLTQICIPMFTSDIAAYKYLTQFFRLRFPRLSAIQLGGWTTTGSVGRALTSFLIAHPLIKDLRLRFSDTRKHERHCHISPGITLDPGTLPRLRHLTADAIDVGIFARSHISSLQTLESLHTGVSYHFEAQERVGFPEMYKALEAYGGLPGLKVLTLELEGLPDDLQNAEWVAGLGRLCPGIEQFWGDFNVGWAAVKKQDIFASYHNLKVQVMPDIGLRNLSKQDKMDRIRQFAAHNPSVTDLRFYNPINVVNFRFIIERDTDGRITSVVEVLGDGLMLKSSLIPGVGLMYS